MKLSEQWLREWVSPKLDTDGLAERLTMAGLEVSGKLPVAANFDRVVVGDIVAVEPHPAAERLRRCQVRIAKSKTIALVSGAPNVATGVKVAVALPGANLPGGSKIEITEIRGETSEGMLCSAADLGWEDESTGILVLDKAAKVGASLATQCALPDSVLEIDLTPNRGDCLSIAGIAREVAAITGARLRSSKIRDVPARSRRSLPVRLGAPNDCPHYAGRVLEGINPRAITPLWMKLRLHRSGVRSIHPVVDVTNYVMLELGQPMHAFDLNKLQGSIRVRHALHGEQLILLGGTEVALEAGTLLIADEARPLALAGIMGGADSAVGADTVDLFLESAYFNPNVIAQRARKMGLQTESSQRFERGVDPTLQRRALQRATALLCDVVGGRPGPVMEQTARRHVKRPKPIRLRASRVTRILGTSIARSAAETTFKRLGMRIRRTAQDWNVVPPSHRFDVTREIDLIEELARVHGYDKIPEHVAPLPPPRDFYSETRVSKSRMRQLLVDRGYQEIISYSFVDPAHQGLLDPESSPIKLSNPISAEMGVMRSNLWPGLVQAIGYNLNRQQNRMRFFEIGRRFRAKGGSLGQDKMLAGAACGPAFASQWGIAPRPVDFYDVKGDIEALMALTGRALELRFRQTRHPALHPGQSATINLGSEPIGWIGALHPEARSRLDIGVPLYVFEIQLTAISTSIRANFSEISKFPSIRRDLAVIVSETTAAQQVLDRITEVAGNLLVNLELFDEYRGEGIDSGRKSLALGLTLQDSSRTLKEVEAERVVSEVLAVLQSELGAELRR